MYLLYFLVWIIFNANVTLEICIFGLVIAAVLFAFTCKFFDYSIDKEKALLLRLVQFFNYLKVLIIEIIKANQSVISFILSGKEEIKPVLVDFDMEFDNEVAKVLMANSITLTPGTITVELEKNHYVVHALDESLAEGMDTAAFVEKIRDLQ